MSKRSGFLASGIGGAKAEQRDGREADAVGGRVATGVRLGL